jgi:hypothetical protein
MHMACCGRLQGLLWQQKLVQLFSRLGVGGIVTIQPKTQAPLSTMHLDSSHTSCYTSRVYKVCMTWLSNAILLQHTFHIMYVPYDRSLCTQSQGA